MASTVTGINTTALDSLLEKVHRDTGFDFREYKRGTVTRRLERRLHATGVKTYPDYMEFLDVHPGEYQKRADDLTIKVSGFFRSPYTFQQVAKLVLPELTLLKRDRGERELRFWSTACARGEEPYSIAILVAEFLGNQRQDFDILICATDISQRALREAQAGVYFSKDVEGLAPTGLKNYFARCDKGYMVKTDIRQMVSLAYFDLTSTIRQPYVNLDCIFCCDVLIYLQSQLQEKVLGMLYDSLAIPGYLILGEVETLTSSLNEKLECLDTKAKIYRKNGRT
jgi:two-component system CheB/CheR fusion protein